MTYFLKNSLFALVFMVSMVGSVLAQPNTRASISGRVLETGTGEPIVGAHVFIANSMIGSVTDLDGNYDLVNVPTGAHRLYVSMLGFESDFLDIMLRTSRAYTFDFELTGSILEAGEIVVEAERDKNWKKRLRKFIRLFIGETTNALETSIINPEVLDFEDKRGTFTAVAAAPLIIENRALGYRIQYFLEDFKSTPSRVQYDGEGFV